MDSLQKSAQGFFAKLILLFLVGCFAIWGIGDVFRSGFGSAGSVAKLGGSSVSAQEFAMAYRNRQEELRGMLGSNFSPEMLKKLNIAGQVLDQLINNHLLAKEMESLGIVVGDREVAQSIAENSAFHNEAGHFDKALYLTTLRSSGINEKYYVESMRRDMGLKLLFHILFASAEVPEETVVNLYKARNEQRVAGITVIGPEALGSVPAPSEADLQKYYDAHHDAFMAPEYRSLSYVELKLADVAAKVNVSDDDIKQAYADRAQELRQPERRAVEQMLFASEAEAKVAASRLAKGETFDAVAKSAPILNKGKTSLGTLTRQGVPGQAGDAVFTLKEGAVSAPVQTPFGWHVFRVTRIIPEGVKPLAEVHDAIAQDLKAKAAQETLYKLVGDLEDALAGGSTLENAAQKVGGELHTIGPMTKDGVSPDGKKIAPPPYPNFMSVAFATSEKDHSPATQANDGSYFLVRADKVTPERLRPLAEVKAQVAKFWQEEKRQAMLQEAADKVTTALHAGKPVAAALAAEHISAATVSSGKLKRDSETAAEGALAGKKLPRMMVLELFGLKSGQSTHAYTWPGGGMAFATLAQVIPAPQAGKDNAALDTIRKELKDQVQGEILEQYLRYLRDKYDVSVNTSVLEHLEGE